MLDELQFLSYICIESVIRGAHGRVRCEPGVKGSPAQRRGNRFPILSPLSLAVVDEQAPPKAFVTALLSLRDGANHPHIEYEEVPPPRRLAPFTAALAMRTFQEDFDQPLATGRFVVLHDPDGQAGWNGAFRLVAQLRSQIDADMGNDPLLSEALWAWAHDCLIDQGASFHDLTGTVTRELSQSFGGLILRGSTLNVELRASWTPSDEYLSDHLSAWSELMCRTCGIHTARFLEGV